MAPAHDLAVVLSDELTPLLHLDHESQSQKRYISTPLPKTLLVMLCLMRVVHSIILTQTSPYINELMLHLNVTVNSGEFEAYRGLMDGLFIVAQLSSIYPWGKLSDRIGRRPVILFSTLGLALATLQIGLSRSLSGVLIARFFIGIFSGSIAVIIALLCELTDVSNQARAFPIFGLCWPIGSFIGPLLGGTLAQPAYKIRVFDAQFWRLYPYILPCGVTAAITLTAFGSGFVFLKETLIIEQSHKAEKYFHTSTSASSSLMAQPQVQGPLGLSRPPHTLLTLLSLPIFRDLCLSSYALSFVGTSFEVIFILFCQSSLENGGLEISPTQTGTALVLAGLIAAGIQLPLMPFLSRKFPRSQVYAVCIALWPLAFMMLPLLGMIARVEIPVGSSASDFDDLELGSRGLGVRVFLWIAIGITLAVSKGGCLAYSVNMILVKEHTRHSSLLGATNGIVQLAMCLAGAISPIFASSVFSFSVGKNFLGGHLWVLIMITICLFGCLFSNRVAEGNGRCKGRRRN